MAQAFKHCRVRHSDLFWTCRLPKTCHCSRTGNGRSTRWTNRSYRHHFAQFVGGVPVHSLGSNLEDLRHIEHLQDPQEVRGSAGVLRTSLLACRTMRCAGRERRQFMLEPLKELLDDLLSTGSDVSFFVHDDHTSGGLMLVRCGCLRAIPSVGFVDFKEQALPMMDAAMFRYRDPSDRPQWGVSAHRIDYIRIADAYGEWSQPYRERRTSKASNRI